MASTLTSASAPSEESLDHFVSSYGDLIFDLCEAVLWNQINTRLAFRAIFKKIQRASRFQKYTTYERCWVLQITYRTILFYLGKAEPKLSSEEQIKLDSNEKLETRLNQFNSYFHRLRPEDQFLLILRDKYGIPYSEIAAAMNTPEDSLRIQRQQALHALEGWLWNNR